MKQRRPLVGLEPITSTLRVRRATQYQYYLNAANLISSRVPFIDLVFHRLDKTFKQVEGKPF